MVLQAHNDGECRIFKGKKLICSFDVFPALKDDVDKHLKLLRMKRRTKWEDTDWGSFASVRFF